MTLAIALAMPMLRRTLPMLSMPECAACRPVLSYCVRDVAQMQRLGSVVTAHVRRGMFITLSGPLGAGKTTLAAAMVRALGCASADETVLSPTYTLVQSYTAHRLPPAIATVHHFDLYRLRDASELEHLGFRDYVDGTSVCIVEWPQRATDLLPPADIAIDIAFTNIDSQRMINICATDTADWPAV